MLELAKLLIGKFGVFVQNWAKGETISGQGRKMNHLVEVPSTSERCLCVGGKRFWEYICDELGAF